MCYHNGIEGAHLFNEKKDFVSSGIGTRILKQAKKKMFFYVVISFCEEIWMISQIIDSFIYLFTFHLLDLICFFIC